MSIVKLFPASFRDRYRDQWHKVVYQFRLAYRRIRPPRLPQNQDGKVYLHLGCGGVNHPLFINVDTMLHDHVHYVRQVESLPMFPDGYADLIYCSHCLEHIPMARTREVLSEWLRVLKDGGILRLAVPDFAAIVEIYKDNGDSVKSIEHYLMGAQSYPANFHYAVFNQASLREHLEAVGFRDVSRWTHEQYPETAVEDCSTMRVSTPNKEHLISLNLQAVKQVAR